MTRNGTALVLLAVMSFSCSPGTPVPDGGGDSGTGGGGAAGGAGGGSGGGTVMPDDACNYTTTPCDAGSSCLPLLLEDGGVGRRCVAGECDLFAQDCPAGLKCAYGDAGRACLGEGTLDEGAPCVGAATGCKKGLVCTTSGNADGGSACSRFCRGAADCASPQQCYVSLLQPGTNERPLICGDPATSCDPLAQNCAEPMSGCYPGVSEPGCYPAGNYPAGSACQFSNDCQRGTACVGSSPNLSCRQLCRFPSGDPACPAGSTCTRLSSSMTVGVCL